MRIFIALTFVFSSTLLFGQLTVAGGLTPAQYAQELVGAGITISNVSYTGTANQIGTFSNGASTNLGIDEGVVLATGNIANIPNQAGTQMSNNMGGGGDTDLTALANRTTYDRAILEFDFVPTGNTVSFDYVFGSEEYPNYVNSNYNDAFGFFLSGPGITGPFSNNATNIALIPGTSTPISINNVNEGYSSGCPNPGSGCTNCAFFVNNCGGTTIVFNGFTTVMTATYNVECGKTYHIKLGVADAGDGVLDSGVFLRRSSMIAPSADIAASGPLDVCGSESITLTVDLSNATPGGTFLWSPGGQTTPSITVTPSGPTTYSVLYTVGDGCDLEDEVFVNIRPNPTVALVNDTICQGESGTLVSNVSPSGGTYSWSGGGGSSSSMSASPGSSTNYTLSYTRDGCTTTETARIVVNPNPEVSAVGGTICEGDQITLVANASPTGGTYSWSNGAGTGSSVTVSPSVTTTYNVTYTDPNGCEATSPVTVVVSETPTINITDAVICPGDAGTITANVSPGGGTYSWTNGGGTSSTVTASPTVTQSYSLTYTTANGCTNSAVGQIVVYQQPTVTATGGEICLNDNTSLNAVGSPSGGAYQWNNGAGTGATVNVSPSSTTNYTVTYTDPNGCVATASTDVEVNPLPNASFNLVNACDEEDVVLTSTATSTSGAITSYSWDVDNNGSTDYMGATSSHRYPSSGVYTVVHEVEDVKGCVNSSSQQVTVYALPTAQFNATNVCEDATTSFTDNSSVVVVDGDAIDTYAWNFGNGSTSTSQNPTLDYGSEGIYDVTLVVTTNHGCENEVTQSVEVYPLPVVNFTPTEVCLDFNTEFTDESTVSNVHTSNSNVSWDWDFGGGASSTDQNPAHTFGTDGVHNVTLTVTTNNGCTNSVTLPVTVNPLPVADFTFVNACDNEDVVLTSAATTTSSGIQVYSWDVNNDNVTDYTGSTASHTFSSDGFHTVVHTVEDANGCVSSASQDVTVYALPSAVFDATSVCEDATTAFTNNSNVVAVDGDVIDSYSWSFGNGSASTAENPTHDYGTEGVYDVTLVVTTNYGCEDEVTEQVEVYPLPTVDFIASEECLNFGTSFTDQSDVSNTHTTNSNVGWDWDFGGGETSADQNPTHTFDSEGTYNVTLTVTTNNDCTNSVTLPVVVNPLPVIDFTFANACDEDEVLLTSTATSASGAIETYSWDVNDDGTVDYTGNTASHTYPGDGFYTVVHTVEDVNGCVSTVSHDVTVYALPIAEFTSTNVCEDATTSFTENSTVADIDGDFVNTYSWSFGNGSSTTAQNPTMNYGAENIYDVTLVVTTNYGCEDEITKQVEVYPLPNVNFSPTEVCLNFDTEFTDESTVSNTHTANSNVQWDWDFGGGVTSSDQNPAHTFDADGTFNVTLEVTTDNDCVNSITIPVTVNPLPIAEFTFVNACDNEDVVMTSLATSVSGAIVDYSWDVDSDYISDYSGVTASHTFPGDGLHTVIHMVEDLNGCRDTISHEVSVYALPIADFDADNVCEDISTEFVNNSTVVDVDGDVITTYNWDFGNGNGSSDQNPIYYYGSENVYEVTLVATSNYGCVGEVTKDVVVYPLPVVDFSPTVVCLGEDTQFSDESTISNVHTANSNVQWDWNFGDGSTGSGMNPNHAYYSPGDYTTTLTVTSFYGCTSQLSKTVTVNAIPDVSFEGVNLEGCSPVCLTVTSTSTVEAPSVISGYLWTLSDGTTYTGSSFSDCLENLSGNDISYGLTLTVTSNNGCVGEHTEANFINVYRNPIADFYFNPVNPDVINSYVDFYNTSLYADSYEWNISSHAPTSQVNPTINFASTPMVYDVLLTAYTDKGCIDTARAVVDIKDRLVFYVPNTFTPDHDDHNEIFKPVFGSGYDPYSYTLLIFNRWGEILFESHDIDVGWDGTYGVDSHEIVQDGTYIWRMEFKESMTDKHHQYTGHVNLLR